VDGGPGVIITEWVSNGTDFLLNNFLIPTDNLRIYPTDLVRTDGDNTYRAYRLIFTSGREPTPVGLFPEVNDNWLSVDSGIYNNSLSTASLWALIKTKLCKVFTWTLLP